MREMMRKIMTTIKKPELVAKRRNQILRASMKLFRKKGYHATTMRGICEKSKVNRGSFYDYFGGKGDVLVYIYKEMMYEGGVFGETFPKVNISNWNDLEPFLRAIILNSWKKNKNAIQLLYRETISLDKKTLREVLRIESGYVRWVAQNLQKGLGLPSINKELEIMANSMVYFNSLMPLRGWNMRHLDQKAILDSTVDMLMMRLRKLRARP